MTPPECLQAFHPFCRAAGPCTFGFIYGQSLRSVLLDALEGLPAISCFDRTGRYLATRFACFVGILRHGSGFY